MSNRVFSFLRNLFNKDRWAYRFWIWRKGDESLLINHDLNNDSVIFDIGGYTGVWTKRMWDKYGCQIYVFEPVKEFVEVLGEKFKNNKKVKIFSFGLGGKTQEVFISNEDDRSSIVGANSKNSSKILIKNINEFIDSSKLSKIDLMSMNIEGSEYELLDALIKSGNIRKVRMLQIQFHKVENYKSKRRELLDLINKTHKRAYNFPFIWEKWVLR